MNRSELEHIVRAVCDLLKEDTVIVGGSQAALAQFPDDLPRSVLMSREADVAALDDPTEEKAFLINGYVGEDTRFHTTHGIYAEGVARELFQLPPGWEQRATSIEGHGRGSTTGLCPEIHDLAVSKLAAGRQKDSEWIRALLRSGHLRAELFLERTSQSELSRDRRDLAVGLVEQAARPGKRNRSRSRIRLLRNLLSEDTGEP
ncbi:MAG: DUF6036 family nucleotidyltransferase [Nitrososphaerales archaeon]